MNNFEFQTSSIDITLTNTQLVFSRAQLIIKSSLFGIRYLMRNWFFVTALAMISMLTSFYVVSFIVFFLTLKSNIRRFLFKLKVDHKQKRKNKMKLKKNF